MGKLLELEKLRGTAIAAVVLIHVTAPATVQYPAGTLKFLFYNTINSLVQFAVPLFLFISSLILSFRLENRPQQILGFYWKRLKGVLIPYLLWSLFYAALRSWLNGSMNQFFSLTLRGEELWTGTAFYHLYFLLIISQLYLVLPLIMELLRSRPLSFALAASVVFQVIFYYLNKSFIYRFYPHPGNLLGSYLPVIFAGCWLGLNYRKYKQAGRVRLGFSLAATLTAALAFVLVNIKVRSDQPVNLGLYYTLYHTFTVLAAWNLLRLMSIPVLDCFLDRLGRHSFAIYLVHPLFLAFWERVFRGGRVINYDVTLLAGFVFVLAGSYCFSLLVSRNPVLSKTILGR